MSCKCQKCGNQYKVDVLVDDELWESRIKPSYKSVGAGLVCGQCILKTIEELDEYDAYRLVKIP